MKISLKLSIIHSLILIVVITILSTIVYNYVKTVFLENEKKNITKKFVHHRRGKGWWTRFQGNTMVGPRGNTIIGFYEIIIVRILPDGKYEVVQDPYDLGVYKEGIIKKDNEYYLMVKERNFIIGKEITPIMISLKNLRNFLVLISISGVGISLFVGFGMSTIFLKPLRRILSDLGKILPENLSIRLPYPKSRDELYFLVSKINEMLDRIEKAYKSQERFVSDVSHELRNPITTLLGYIKMLKRWGKENEKILKESLEAMESTAEDMKNLVESLLLMTKPDTKIFTEEIDLEEFIRPLLDKWKKRYSREIKLKVKEPAVVKTNPEYLEIMLNSLIDNAIKYSEKPVEVVIDGAKISVIDKGPGIPKEKQKEIFQRFRRLVKNKEGHGIGLSIVKELADRLNIEVKLKSEVGKGSEFILSFRKEE